jgi:hypothetical protein
MLVYTSSQAIGSFPDPGSKMMHRISLKSGFNGRKALLWFVTPREGRYERSAVFDEDIES